MHNASGNKDIFMIYTSFHVTCISRPVCIVEGPCWGLTQFPSRAWLPRRLRLRPRPRRARSDLWALRGDPGCSHGAQKEASFFFGSPRKKVHGSLEFENYGPSFLGVLIRRIMVKLWLVLGTPILDIAHNCLRRGMFRKTRL